MFPHCLILAICMFLFFTLQLRAEPRAFNLSITGPFDKDSRKTPSPCAVWWFACRWTKAPGQVEGYHSLFWFFFLTKKTVKVSFFRLRWLDGWIGSTRNELGPFSRHLCGGEPPHNVRRDPIFLVCKAGAFPQLATLERGYFFFQTRL